MPSGTSLNELLGLFGVVVADRVLFTASDLEVAAGTGVNLWVLYLGCPRIVAVLLVNVSSDLSLDVASSLESTETTADVVDDVGLVIAVELLARTSGIVTGNGVKAEPVGNVFGLLVCCP